jgi:uncharacterized protein
VSARSKLHVAGVIRWSHTYLSLIGFAAILFFAVTGLTLNHATWFESGSEHERTLSRAVPAGLLPSAGSPDLERVQRWLRDTFQLHGDLNDATFGPERGSIVFKGPGYTADVEIDVASGTAVLHETRLNSWAMLDDLHKGRDSGATWGWVIDVSAIVIAVSALTGIWLLFYVKRRRVAGVLVAVIGLLMLALVGWLWTP